MNSAQQIKQAIEALEGQRSLLGDLAVDAAIGALRAQLPSADSGSQELRLTGERKLVTVMFADISGFTALSERNDPEVVRALMNACFDCLVPVINEYEGTIDKFIGDEIMALFGAPKAHERHAELACTAALEMFKALKLFNQRNGTSLELHIGINTGLVIAGGIGSVGRQDYSVMGDAVNLAARLKDAASNGEIFVGAEVHALTNHAFEYNAIPPLRLKGKSDLVRTWRLQTQKKHISTQREGALQSRLIGRKTELNALEALIRQLQKGRGACLSIIGEAGMGKSRLITEVKNQTDQDIYWIEGRSMAYTRQRAYQPAQEILYKLLAPKQNLEGEALKTHLQEELQRLLGDEWLSSLPYLCHMMQLPLRDEEDIAVRYLKSDALREKIYATLSSYLVAKAKVKPLVLIWEDLHWVDPSSLALIERLVDLCPKHPIAHILVFRPQREEKIWLLHEQCLQKYPDDYQAFQLEPLNTAECTTLVRNLMFVDNIAPEVEQLLMEKAEGNPFFMEELLRSLMENGMLYQEGQMIKASEGLDTLIIPGTLQGVIASRIDQLDEADKHILQIASILGRIFREVVLEALLSVAKKNASLSPALQRLVERELLRSRPDEEVSLLSYIFKHAVTHDVAYNSLLLSDRKTLHRLAGETIEKLAGTNQVIYAEPLGFHYERADQPEKAIYFLCIAAEQAKAAHFNEEAIELYRRAVVQAEMLFQKEGKTSTWRSTLVELLENQADIQRLMGQAQNAQGTYAAAIEHLDTKDWIGHSRLLRKTGMCLQVSSQFESIYDYFQQAEQFLEKGRADANDTWWHEWLEVMNERMFLFYWVNRAEDMQRLALVIEPYLVNATPAQQARFYSNLVLLDFRLDRFLLAEKTVDLAKKAVDACSKSNDLPLLAYTQFIWGFAYLWCNQMNACIPILEESLALAEKTGDIVVKSRALTYLVVAHRRLGDVINVELYAQKSLLVAQQSNMPEYQGTASANLAWVAWKNKDLAKTEPLAKQAFDYWSKIAHNHSSLVFVWIVAFPLVALYWQQGKLSQCIEQLETMVRPTHKKLEPDLEESILRVLNKYRSIPVEKITQADMDHVLALAEQYQYL